MISVIAPNLNEKENLKRFLCSLDKQTFRDFEVIIVDGGSTDGSLKSLEEYNPNLSLLWITDHTRNFGHIRNLGAKFASGEIMFHCNTDNHFESDFLEKLDKIYSQRPEVVSVSGRVYPCGSSILAPIAYQLFDFFRFLFTCFPKPIQRYRPSGNFLSIRSETFRDIGGFPEVRANEDGLLGERLDRVTVGRKAVMFRLDMYVAHKVKKFEAMGGLNALLFYFYVLGNFAPFLRPLLKPAYLNACAVFEGKKPIRLTVKEVARAFWEWL